MHPGNFLAEEVGWKGKEDTSKACMGRLRAQSKRKLMSIVETRENKLTSAAYSLSPKKGFFPLSSGAYPARKETPERKKEFPFSYRSLPAEQGQ